MDRACNDVPCSVDDYDIVVSLGTDYHPFDRLVDWVDDYLGNHPGVTCLMQHGASRPSVLATSVARLPQAHLLELYRHARVVVVQGGPGSILDARGQGRIPLVVPRTVRLAEVVDNHQIAFTDHMVAQGEAHSPSDAAELALLLDAAMDCPSAFSTPPREARPEKASRALDECISRAALAPWTPRVIPRRLLQAVQDVLRLLGR